MALRLEVKTVGDYYVVTSPDVPALYVADLDREVAIALAPEQAAALEASAARRAERDRVRHPVDFAA